ncbi:hypothetical protein M9H77_31043 [Catharanthus roseus]|uniref:Uncharacterized protein n=1 Tax=Catharanthus roseus TaxID=4058 RepID=A0ACB9ZZX4_CATRO|nr:hypothetical protein M9H77_31043 [Catharanthus roseus]
MGNLTTTPANKNTQLVMFCDFCSVRGPTQALPYDAAPQNPLPAKANWGTWTNSSWQRMKAIGRQEMAYSKLARARSNCYKDGGYDGNAYEGSHNRNGHYTYRSQIGIGNFSSRAKTFDHIPYKYCCENCPYDVHKRSFGDIHNIASFNNSISNVAHLLWLLNRFEDESFYGETQDKHEDMKIFQGPGTRSRARKLEEENEEMVAFLRSTFKITRGRHWNGENEEQRCTKTFLMSIKRVKKAKGTSLEYLEDSISNGEEGMNPIAGGRVHLPSTVRSWQGSMKCYLPPTVGSPYRCL